MKNYKTNHFESKVVHGYAGYDDKTGAVSYPIYQSATFRHPGLYETTGFDYSRLKNPTRSELENTICLLEEGVEGFAFSSGMASISTVIKLFKSGDHIIASHDLYGGTYRILVEIYSHFGIEVTFVNPESLENFTNVIKPNTKAIFIETPSNPTMQITDIVGVSKIAKSIDALLIVDNTFMTPYYQKPIKLGADIVVHSGTKFLGGHNDTLAGFVVVNSEELAEKIFLLQKSEGAMLAPFDSWLILRGIKTLVLRMDKSGESALKIAEFLVNHPSVSKVYYPGLTEHVGYEINKSQSTGFGSMISFEVKEIDMIAKVLRKVKLVTFAESLGGVESLITYPMEQTHKAIPKDIRDKVGVTDQLLRLSVGIEHLDDIIEDLKQALE